MVSFHIGKSRTRYFYEKLTQIIENKASLSRYQVEEYKTLAVPKWLWTPMYLTYFKTLNVLFTYCYHDKDFRYMDETDGVPVDDYIGSF